MHIPISYRIESVVRKTALCIALVFMAVLCHAPSASADPHPDRYVTFTVTAEQGVDVSILSLTEDVPTQNVALKKIMESNERVKVTPNSPWTRTVTMKQPRQWGYISATGGRMLDPKLTCTISVDDKIISQTKGGAGVECSTRRW